MWSLWVRGMSEQHFEVVFRGDVEPGQSVIDVKGGLAKLFKADPARIEQMFSGKPVVIKSNLDEETALHYQSSLQKVGAIVEIRSNQPVDSAVATDAQNSNIQGKDSQGHGLEDNDLEDKSSFQGDTQDSQESDPLEDFDFDFDVAPVGADMMPDTHKKEFVPADVDTSHLTVSETGTDVLEKKDQRSYEERAVDTSHLSVEIIAEPEEDGSEV